MIDSAVQNGSGLYPKLCTETQVNTLECITDPWKTNIQGTVVIANRGSSFLV